MLNAMMLETEEALDVLLGRMNETGVEPVLIGLQADGAPFLAYGWAPGGDGWDCGVVYDNPRDTEGDVWDKETGKSHPRCEECAAYYQFDLETLHYPVRVFSDIDLPTHSDSYPSDSE